VLEARVGGGQDIDPDLLKGFESDRVNIMVGRGFGPELAKA
jgi:hypothetical protein